MKKNIQPFLLFFTIILIGVLVVACATKSYIRVNYRLPLSSYDLKGKKIFLEFKDMRSVNTIFSEKAKAKFKHHAGLFLFSLSKGEKHTYVAGTFDLPSLFTEAFSKRLENMGVEVLTQQKKTEPVVEIVLQNFLVDLVNRRWVAEISYEARLIKDNTLLITETVSGKAERFKVLSHKDAELVLGDIFTDVVNKPDFGKLFKKAEL